MEKFPNEILLKVFERLDSRLDSLNLASTCTRFDDLLPLSLDSLDLEELMLGGGRVAPPINFLTRNDLASRIKTVRVDTANGDDKLATYLENVFESCPNIQTLMLENDGKFMGSSKVDPSFLTDFLSAISVQEFHCKKNLTNAPVTFPQNVEKCTISLVTLAEMYRRHVDQQPPAEDGSSSFLRSVKSLRLWCDEPLYDSFRDSWSGQIKIPHSIWRMLSGIPHLEELALIGRALPFLDEIASEWQPQSQLKVLTLEVPFHEAGLNDLLRRCPFVEIVHFNVNVLNEFARIPTEINWPTTLKKIHIYDTHIHRCRRAETSVLRRNVVALFQSIQFLPNLETVTQDLPFEGMHLSCPGCPSCQRMNNGLDHYPIPHDNCIEIVRKFEAGVLKDWFITIREPADWTELVSLLRPVSRLEHLYVYVWLDNEYDADQIETVYPKIATEIAHLTVNDNHVEHTTSFNILTSFANVRNYSINCDAESRLFQNWSKDQRISPSSALRLDLVWSKEPMRGIFSHKYDQLGNFSNVTHLMLRSGLPEIQIDLEKIKDAVGANLKFLEVNNFTTNRYYKSLLPIERGLPIVDPSKIGTCLRFPKLQRFNLKENDVRHFEAFQQSLENLKPFLAWPSHLRSILLHFDDGDDEKTILAQNCGIEISVRCLALERE